MNKRSRCPSCGSRGFKKNGHIHNGKQNHQCHVCERQFVLCPENKVIKQETKDLIRKSLLERNSLLGICRIFDVSLTWLLSFIHSLYEALPDHLNFVPLGEIKSVVIHGVDVQADEMWSFVQTKDNKQWIWIALDVTTRQVIAFYIGDRSRIGARELWERIPELYRDNALFYTDLYESYVGVIPHDRHHRVTKDSGKTSYIERFNCTVRQRVSRLVRKTLSFSKKLENHIGAIKYFICHYNLERRSALLV